MWSTLLLLVITIISHTEVPSHSSGRRRFGADVSPRMAVVRGGQCEGLAGIFVFVLISLRKIWEFVITIILVRWNML
jgi:hypothetical protein